MAHPKFLSSEQMRALEKSAIMSGKVTGLKLMERAGQGVVDAVFEQWPTLANRPHRAVVLCGPGNNGGDGFVVARLLRELKWEVDAFLYGDPSALPDDAKTNYDRAADMMDITQIGFPCASQDGINAFQYAVSHMKDVMRDPAEELGRPGPFLLVDALFGIGLTRPLKGLDDLIWHWDYLLGFRDLNDARVVAVDVPSGMDADTSEVVGRFEDGPHAVGVLQSDLTVTFHAPKTGHGSETMRRLGGKVVVKDIGL